MHKRVILLKIIIPKTLYFSLRLIWCECTFSIQKSTQLFIT